MVARGHVRWVDRNAIGEDLGELTEFAQSGAVYWHVAT